MNIISARSVRKAIEATTIERARSLVVEQGIAVGMIVAIGAVLFPLLGNAGPDRARAEHVGVIAEDEGGNMLRAPNGRHDRHTREGVHTTPQGLRDVLK